ncbi:MAG: hypothetical protein JWR84_1679 [Caulobacter sp.]|nr:hypothetical protein [Caulobacter sp.]
MLLVALMASLMLAPNEALPRGEAAEIKGTIGVCLRWRDDHKGVAEAVVVESSGSRELDRAMVESIKSMNWPVGDNYRGDWIGVRMELNSDGAPDNRPLPDCSKIAGERPKGI